LVFKNAYDEARQHILSAKTYEDLKGIQNVWKCTRKNYKKKN
jgi:hypothetical protein